MFENQFCKIKNCHESVSEGKEYCEIHAFENMVNQSFSFNEETNEGQLEEKEIRNILLIGYTGNGKSTLANVITGTNNFKESESGISETKEVQVEKFELDGIIYRIIDTAGIGDTQLSKEEILNKLEGAASVIRNGLSQVLFITSGRFAEKEKQAYNLLQEVIFDKDIGKYTTIVRTKFPSFRKIEKCEADRQGMIAKDQDLARIIEAVNGFIHVNNLTEEEEPELKSREDSRGKLLEHLKNCQAVYQTEFLSKFCEAVEKFNSIIEETEKAINFTESHFNDYNNQLKKFISDREVVVKLVEERKEKLNENMKSRFVFNTTGHAISLSGKFLLVAGMWFPPAFVPGAVLSVGSLLGVSSSEAFWITEEKNLYDLFEENLNKDKENREKLENLQTELKNSIGRFREIYDQFKDSEYKKQDIDKKKIEIVKKVIKKVLGEEIETSENSSEEKNHSTTWKAGRATLEALAKCAPFPNPLLGFYLAYRDYQEIENRTSLSDMERVIENWKEELKTWKDKEEPLNEEYKEIRDCQKEVEKLSLDNKLKREENTQSSSSQEQIFQIEQPPK